MEKAGFTGDVHSMRIAIKTYIFPIKMIPRNTSFPRSEGTGVCFSRIGHQLVCFTAPRAVERLRGGSHAERVNKEYPLRVNV